MQAATTAGADAAPNGGTEVPPKPAQQFGFCRGCGSAVELVIPEGDTHWRHVCTSPGCARIDYINPRMVCGCIVEHEGKILLCRRGIEPQRGLWTVPAGFLEQQESTAAGAVRETWEEAAARVEGVAPYCHFDIPVISQAYILFRARLAPPYTFAAQHPESLEAALFAPEDIPFDQVGDVYWQGREGSLFLLNSCLCSTCPLYPPLTGRVPETGPAALPCSWRSRAFLSRCGCTWRT